MIESDSYNFAAAKCNSNLVEVCLIELRRQNNSSDRNSQSNEAEKKNKICGKWM